MPKREFAESLSVARRITLWSLGDMAALHDAHTASGMYSGRIIGETKYHTIQRLSSHSAVAHPKHLLDEEPSIGQAVRIRYSNGQGMVREYHIKQRGRDLGR